VAGDRDRPVEADRDVHARVVDDRDPLVGGGQPVNDVVRAVGRGRERQDELDRAGIVLREDARDGRLDVVDLVVHGHHIRDAGTRFRRQVHRVRLSTR
jgi:hypothetical protein